MEGASFRVMGVGGESVEVISDKVVMRSPGEGGKVRTISSDLILNVEIEEKSCLTIFFTDIEEEKLQVENFSLKATDEKGANKVCNAFKV